VLGLTLALYGAGTWALLRSHARDELDHRLEEDLGRAVRGAAVAADGTVWWRNPAEFARRTSDPSRGHWAEIWSGEGRLLLDGATSQPLELGPVPSTHELHAEPRSRRIDGRRVRVMARLQPIDGQLFAVRVAISEEPMHHRLGDLLKGLAAAFPLMLGLAALGGRAVLGRALAPLAEMARRAHRISAERLSDRLAVPEDGGELAQLAAAFNEAFARLEQSFGQLQRFTADASHELRTPLTALRSVGEVGLAPGKSAAEYREVVASMLEEADRLTRLVDALLQLSRAEAGRLALHVERLDLGALACDVAQQLAVLAEERGQQLACDSCARAEIDGDRVVLRMAVMNLIDNAIKYGRVGGRVELATTTRDDGAIDVAIRDDGPGISPEHHERVFDRFFRVDRDRARVPGGAGLGLALARWAAEAHGGRIELESTPGAGSTFRLVLPAAAR
jgi:heavy metal sensor kinase